MKTTEVLPKGYEAALSVDLQGNKKQALLVNAVAIVIALVLAVPMCFLVPITHLFDMEQGLWLYFLRFLALLLGMGAYLVLHELTHGVAMKLCGTKKVKYGFTGLYAYAGSSDYYGKGAYIFIALAPVILWGAVLAILAPLIPVEWFWVVYLIQITNLSGAAGDFYVTARFSRLPKDILVQDSGTAMTVYQRGKDAL